MESRVKAGVGAGVLAVAAALTFWVWREPGGAISVPPLQPLKVSPPADKARGADQPENEAVPEDAPLMPVGTADLPEQLDRHQLEAGMEVARKYVERCRSVEEVPFVGTVEVRLTIAKTGSVQSVAVVAPPQKTPIGDCVAKAVRNNASFPKFRGTLVPTIELTFPFLFRGDGLP